VQGLSISRFAAVSLASAVAVSSACVRHTAGTARPSIDAMRAAGVRSAVLDVPHGAALFAGPNDKRTPVGYARDAEVDIVRDARTELVEVRVRGPLEVQGFAPADQLYLRVQRRGQLRGSGAYLAPGNKVRIIGPGEKPSRVQVEAQPVVNGSSLPALVGTFPLEGLLATAPPTGAEGPETGRPHSLGAGLPMALHDGAGGALMMVLPPQPRPVLVEVLFEEQGWRAVRVGDGPYLAGFTQAPIVESPRPAAAPPPLLPPTDNVPLALQREPGELMGLLAGTEVRFDGRVLGRLSQPGFARVLHRHPNGEVDVFAAVDDHVAIRGLVQHDRLQKLAASAPAVQPAPPAVPAPSLQPELTP
jgi:hypothetical protein